MNDVINLFSKCSIYLYADDIVIFKSGSDIANIIYDIQSELDKFSIWTDFSDLDINLLKTRKMIFSRKKINNISLQINGTLIETVNEYKYLGLLIDDKLTFKPHILEITKKSNQVNGRIFFMKQFIPVYILRKIFFSILYPHLTQHILIWGGTSHNHLNPLIVSVNKVIRNMLPTSDNTATKYKNLNILTIPQIYMLHLGQFFSKHLF